MFRYGEEFYKFIEQTKIDEQTIMPLVMRWLSPKSIVDFGCAEGAWLREALRLSSDIEILGMDGDYVNRERLKIPEKNFRAVDLRKSILLERRYDLAISTEVAEHLEEKFADIFIDNITKASDQVLFSAAIPGQGGTHHVNEQWQSYWIKKFEKRGYYCDYSVRNYFWDKIKISSWRRQNILFFSKEKKCIAPEHPMVDVVHPEEVIIRERILKEMADFYIFHSELPAGLEQVIKTLVKQDKRIVVYPYGSNGKLCEKILREKYQMRDYILADNYAVVDGKDILTAAQLKDLANMISVIDTCNNPLIHKEVIDELRKYVDEENIYSAFKIEEL